MSFGWERVGGYASVLAAEQWCDRAGIARNDRDFRYTADGVELLVRATAVEDKESDPRSPQHVVLPRRKLSPADDRVLAAR